MKRKIRVTFIIVLALALGSGGFVVGEQLAAQAESTQAKDAYLATGVNVDFVGQIGGSVHTVAVVGNYAYIGEGPGLTILDISAPNAPSVVGRTEFLPDIVQDVAISGNYAYLADYDSGLRVVDVSDAANPFEVGFYATPDTAYGVAVEGNYAYVVDGYGLWVIDISDTANPVYSSSWHTIGNARSVAVAGGYAYVADWWGGLVVIDVSDPASLNEVGFYSTPSYVFGVAVEGGYAYITDASGCLRVIDVSDPINPSEVGFYATPDTAEDVAVEGGYAYVADYINGLRVIDVSDPINPSEVGFYTTPGRSVGVAVAGDYAYMADLWRGLRIVDVSDKASPRQAGDFDYTLGTAQSLAAAGNYAYVADGWTSRLSVIDVSNPASPSEVSVYNMVGGGQDVEMAGGYIYLAVWGRGLRVIDASNPTSLSEVGFYDTPGATFDVVVVGDYAYLADYDGLRVIDVSEPDNPSEVGFSATPGYAYGVAVSGDYAYVADGPRGLRVIDVSDPTDPIEVGACVTPGSAENLAVAGGYAYVADASGGLRIINVSDPTFPLEVSHYATPDIAGDVVVAGGYAYVTADESGLRVIDVSNPTNPSEVGYYDTPGQANGVALLGSLAIVADFEGGLIILEIMGTKDESNTMITSDSPDPSLVGQPIAVTFEVAAESGVPSGSVTVTVAGQAQTCTGILANGVGGCEITLNTPGAYNLLATYRGDNAFAGSSAVEEHIVKDDTAITILSDEPDPSQVGQPISVAFDVVASYGVPSGEVTVTVAGEAASCTGRLSGGSGGCEITLNDPGIYTLTASYSGDAHFLPSSTTEQHTVVKGDTTITILSDAPDPSQVGQLISVAFEVTAVYGTPTGSVTVSVAGETETCTDTLTNGTGECQITLNDPGTYTLTATYSGDGHFLSSASTEQHTVVKADSAITIYSDEPDPSQVGEPISVAFEVTAGYGTPSGSVTVTVAGETETCTDTLTNGTGGCQITLDNPGTYTLTASYSGDGDFLPSSTTEQHTVEDENTVKQYSATTILSDAPDPSQVGEPFLVAFEVTADYGTPSGSVTVTVVGETESCTGTLAGGTGGCQITLNNPGTYTLTASYSGDDGFLPSSTTAPHAVVKGDTAITILSDEPDPSQVGEVITVTFGVTASYGNPSGVVHVQVAGEAMDCLGTLMGGTGECQITFSVPGAYTLMADYGGDGDFLPSSVVEEHTVVDQNTTVRDVTTTTILSDDPDPSQVDQPITVTFEVTAESGIPSGVVHVQVAGEAMDCFGTLTGGTGECEIITLTVPRTYTLTAAYGGDNDFLPSSDVEEHEVVEEPAALTMRLFLPVVIGK
jgi:hypothetical protein